MREILINRSFGGFYLSERVLRLFVERKGAPYEFVTYHTIPGFHGFYCTPGPDRDDPVLISTVKEIGLKDSAEFHDDVLRIVEVPDDVLWYIEEHDGLEHVAERHRRWPEEDDV